jgi:hypothetical protein
LLMNTCTIIVNVSAQSQNVRYICKKKGTKDLRVKLHITRNCHSLFPLVDLSNSLFQISPYFLEIYIFQSWITIEEWPYLCHVDLVSFRRGGGVTRVKIFNVFLFR